MTLDGLLKVARAQEAVSRQLKAMEGNASSTGQVNAVGGKNSGGAKKPASGKEAKKSPSGDRDKKKICFGCGREGHFQGDKKCPAHDQACRKCGRIGHFYFRCPQGHHRRGGRFDKNAGTGRGSYRNGCDRNKFREANFVEDEHLSAGPIRRESPDYAFTIGQNNDILSPDRGMVTLTVGGVDLADVLIDSGATCNLMGQQTWCWLKAKGIQCESRNSAKVLFAYGGTEPLPTLGTFSATVISPSSNTSCQADFVVIEGDGRTLLGRETAEMLSLLHVSPLQVNSVVSEHSEDDIRRRYQDLFTGIGQLKDYELKLHLDDSVKPVAQPVRRIPFGLRAKVDGKLDELLQADIIEEIPEGPSSWISPLVVVPKSDGDVRVCVDMRRANEAIIRERHPIPTVEELLHDLNGSTVFSKVDLKWGFHQILLSEDSRHITTFVTHRGLYRYKRLMFGVTSAPEKYQQIIRDVLRGCEGVANIADDLVIHGNGVEEHDKRLFGVLDRLREVGLTLNGNKCEFRLSKLTFFGHELTSNGINPSEEKIAAIRDARPPKDASEVRSFMGLVQYSAKFTTDVASVAKPKEELTRKSTKFVWGAEQETAFQELKRMITQADTPAYYKVGCRTRTVADASPVGLGAVLTQLQGDVWRVIAYASRSLTDVERRYSQTEKEALALVWACERFTSWKLIKSP